MNRFFLHLYHQFPQPRVHGLHLSVAVKHRINTMSQSHQHNHTITLTKRRLGQLSKRKEIERLDEDVLTAKRARQPPGLRNAAEDSDFDTLLLLTFLHIGHPSPTLITSDCAELIERIFTVVFQFTHPQRPEVLRNLVLGTTITEVELWKSTINIGHCFKTGRHFPSVVIHLENQIGILASLLIRYALPNKQTRCGNNTTQPAYLLTTTRGLPFTSATFSGRFRAVSWFVFVLFSTHQPLLYFMLQFTGGSVARLPYTPNVVG